MRGSRDARFRHRAIDRSRLGPTLAGVRRRGRRCGPVRAAGRRRPPRGVSRLAGRVSAGTKWRADITSTCARSRSGLHTQLGCNPLEGTTYAEWLTMPQQTLLGVVRGAVYHDADRRARPPSATDSGTSPPTSRCGCSRASGGGSGRRSRWSGAPPRSATRRDRACIASRIVRDLMRLHFVLERELLAVREVVRLCVPAARRAAPRCCPRSKPRSTHPTTHGARTRSSPRTSGSRSLHNASRPDRTARPERSRSSTAARSASSAPDRFVQACLRARRPEAGALPLIGSIDQIVGLDRRPGAAGRSTWRLRALYDAS